MKILIISYFFFPENTPRAFRTSELAVELAKHGHEVTVALPYNNKDSIEYAEKNRIKLICFEDTPSLKRNNTVEKILTNILFRLSKSPSIPLMFFIKQFILKNKENFDGLISIANPHSIHWAVALSKKKNSNFPKIWVADCGDPYMGSSFSKKIFLLKYIEKYFCSKCDFITIPIKDGISAYYKEYRHKIRVIPQGFNFENLDLPKYKPNNVPTFIYAGTFYKNHRDPRPFLDYLLSIDREFIFIIYTNSDELVRDYQAPLKNKLIIRKSLSRNLLLKELALADFLINLENSNKIQLPSKLIDYKLVNRPVMNIKTNNINQIVFNEFMSKDYKNAELLPSIAPYDIKNVTNQFLDLLNEQNQK